MSRIWRAALAALALLVLSSVAAAGKPARALDERYASIEPAATAAAAHRAVRHARVRHRHPAVVAQRPAKGAAPTAPRRAPTRAAASPQAGAEESGLAARTLGALITGRASLPTSGGAPLDYLPRPLVAWLDRVATRCAGFVVISTRNHSRLVMYTRRVSLHVLDRAADFQVADYGCARQVLARFPGGMSIDPWRVGHVHVSWSPGGSEWGRRFNHWRPLRLVRRSGRQL